MNKKKVPNEWKELREQHETFLKIMRLLVEFDERVGRHRRYSNPEHHYMRKAVAVASEGTRRIFVQELGEHIFFIIVQLETEHGFVVTSWVHEDGIAMERMECADNPGHPVHSIACLTDLVRSGCIDFHGILKAPSVETLRLMAGEC